MAPSDDTPERWADLPWRFCATGEPVPFSKPDASGPTWRLRTVEDVLKSCTYAHPHAALDYRGQPCDGRTRGPLMQMAVRDGRKFVTGKDRIGRRPDDPVDAFSGEMKPDIRPADGKTAFAVLLLAKIRLFRLGEVTGLQTAGLAAGYPSPSPQQECLQSRSSSRY